MRAYLILFSLLIIENVNGQSISTDRPSQTESSSTIPKTNFQIESGILLSFSDGFGYSDQQLLLPTTLFRYGLFKGFEVRIISQLESSKNLLTGDVANGLSDAVIGFKKQLFQKEGVNTEIAFISHLIIPTASSSMTSGSYGSSNKLSIGHSLNDKVALGYNVGYNYFGIGNGDLTYSIALGVEINNKAAFYIEPFGEVVTFKTHHANIDAGIIYLVRDNFQLDFSFGTGINQVMNYISTGFGWIIR